MRNSRYHNVVDTDYPAIRRVMVSAGDHLDDAELENVIEHNFPGAGPEDVENFFRTIQRFGSTIAPLAQKALPGIAKGAIQGFAMGGPVGAIVGAAGGGAASVLSGGGPAAAAAAARAAAVPRPSAVPPQPATPAPPPPAAAAIPTPAPPAPPAVAAGAAAPAPEAPAVTQPLAVPTPPSDPVARVAWLASRPELWQSMLGMLMPSQGRQAVPVGNQQVPAAAFANALAELAADWAESAATWSTGSGEHLVDSNGMPRGDLANPRERAALLLGDLAEVAAAEEGEMSESEQDFSESDWGDTSDAIDSYEAALEGRY